MNSLSRILAKCYLAGNPAAPGSNNRKGIKSGQELTAFIRFLFRCCREFC